MKNYWLFTLVLVVMACGNTNDPEPTNTKGYNMLLIGNSFFKPYALHLDALADHEEIENHAATVVFRGGDNGRPINFWNDEDSNEHQLIKETLDQGDIEIFGMTAGVLPENPTDGFREWIAYAVGKNPDVIILLSIPPLDFPADWEQLAASYGYASVQELYAYFVNNMIHQTLVEPLRAEFPSTQIFTVPTGWATIQLAQMQQDDQLLDEISLFGAKETSIFTDAKGHQGQIVIEAGALLWLNGIYGIDLSTNTYDTGFTTDLHKIAADIMSDHDANYVFHQ